MAARPISEPVLSSSFGRYRMLAQLGQGGMGAIHLALMQGSGEFEKLVVIKELRPDLAKNAEFVSMFLHEAKLAGRLNHTNIVQTLEAGRVSDRYFLSMEYLDGQPFSDLLFASKKQSPEVPLALRLQVVCDVLAGLHHAHELRDFDQKPLLIVHCDVSPSNVFITYDGCVKVIDFGVARAAGKTHDPGSFQGKLRYAAPEQLTGRPIDRRADVFSAGVLLWEAIALRRFCQAGPMDQAALDRRIRGLEPSILHAVPQVDPALAVICDRALRVNPAERFATADEFRAALLGYATARGHRLDASEIARTMKVKFASERAAKHLLIHQQFRQEGAGGTPPILRDAISHDDVTTVADLSTFVRATRQSDPMLVAEPLLQSNRTRRLMPVYLAVGAMALAAMIVGVSTWSSSAGSSDSGSPRSELSGVDQDEVEERHHQAGPVGHGDVQQFEHPEANEAAQAHGSVARETPQQSAKTEGRSPQRVKTDGRPQQGSSQQGEAAQNHAVRGSSSSEAMQVGTTTLASAHASLPTTIPPPDKPAPANTPKASDARPQPKSSVTDGFGRALGDPSRRERRALDQDNPFRSP